MIKCIDNFLPKPVLSRLINSVNNMSWFYSKTNYTEDDWTFSHHIEPGYPEDGLKELSLLVASFIAEEIKLPIDNLLRVRYALMLKKGENSIVHAKHLDYDNTNHITSTIYLNDNNGYLYIYDNEGNTVEKIKPTTNRITIFDGDIWHSTSTPTDTHARYAVTFNFEVR